MKIQENQKIPETITIPRLTKMRKIVTHIKKNKIQTVQKSPTTRTIVKMHEFTKSSKYKKTKICKAHIIVQIIEILKTIIK